MGENIWFYIIFDWGQKSMQTNLWNLKNSKERIGIREKTEAHKRHLISLVKAKSNIDDRNKKWKVKSLNANYNHRVNETIRKDNQDLVDRLCNIEKISSSRLNTSASKGGNKFISITQNLRSMATISRQNRHRQIADENSKFFNRLINTSPTLSRKSWIKGIHSNNQYKLNMSRSKYSQPDYSHEVTRSINTRKPTFRHLKLSRCDELPNVSSRLKKIR